MHFEISKTALDSLKSVFNVFWKKAPMGASKISIKILGELKTGSV